MEDWEAWGGSGVSLAGGGGAWSSVGWRWVGGEADSWVLESGFGDEEAVEFVWVVARDCWLDG